MHIIGSSLLRAFKCQLRPQLQQFRLLNLLEYQNKELLHMYGCSVQQYILATNRREAEEKLNFGEGSEYVVKAQILAGGRGKGEIVGSQKNMRGVFVTKDKNMALDALEDMIGKRLITAQTNKSGVLVEKVMVAKAIMFERETYLAIILDADTSGPLVISSPVGGVDIEEVAKRNPQSIHKEPIDLWVGITDEQCNRIISNLGFQGKAAKSASEQILRLYSLFCSVDATQIEINPFAIDADGRAYCIDAKMTIDDNSEFRQQAIFELSFESAEDIRELEAKKHHLNYVSLEGTIACLVNGAGLAMATMDMIKLHGGSPANFLDLSGSVGEEQVSAAINIITSDPQVRAILVNIFGGIVNCKTIARGLIAVYETHSVTVPLVVRLEGNNVSEARAMLDRNRLPIIAAESLDEAAKIAISVAS